MSRFGTKQKKQLGLPLSAGLFALVFLLFLLGISNLSEDTKDRQRQELETALNRSILTCYALEGRYPENLSYLREHYPLHYNEDLFFVDYQVRGANLMPDVTIIERGG